MRRAHANRQGELAALTASPAGVQPFEIVPDGVNVFEGGEQVPRQDHILDHFGDLAVPDHVGVAGTEREILELGLAAVGVAGVDAEFDILDHVLEGGVAVVNARIGHANDGSKAIVDGAGVARGFLTHLGGGLTRVQAANQLAVTDEPVASGGRAFIVVEGCAAQVREGAVIEDVEQALSEAAAHGHHFAGFGVLVHEVRFGEVTEGFVDEDARQHLVNHHRILPRLDRLGGEQFYGFLGSLASQFIFVQHVLVALYG